MEITVSLENARVPVQVIHIDGNIDSSNYQQFQSKADDLIASGARHILIDLAKAPFVSSAGLRVIHNVFNALRALHKDADDDALRKSMSSGAYKAPYIKVANPAAGVRETLELGGFDTYIEVFDDLQKALNSF